MPGIVGAALAGMSAACKVLGPSGYPRINRALRAEATKRTNPKRSQGFEAQRSAGARRYRATVQRANWITPTIRDITLQLPQDETLGCGSVRARAGRPFEWRPYSIASAPGQAVRLLVTCAPRGMVRRGHATRKAATRWILNSRTGTSSTTRRQEARTRALPRPAAAFSSLLEQVSHRPRGIRAEHTSR